jgi:hypothetical protein
MRYLALAVAVSSGCLSLAPSRVNAPREVSLGSAFDLRVGDAVRIAGEPLTITFDRVTDDSRCPTNVTCVWAGDAIVHLRLDASRGRTGALDLHENVNLARDGAFESYRISLQRLEPPRQDGTQIAPDRYVVTLLVSRT